MAEVSDGRDGNRVGVPPETLEAIYAHSARLQSVAMMTRATSRILIEEARALRDRREAGPAADAITEPCPAS